MTTHETRPEMETPREPADTSVREDRPIELGAPEEQPIPVETGPTGQHADVETVGPTGDFEHTQDIVAEPQQGVMSPAEPAAAAAPAASGATDQMLFGDGELTAFHSRWTEVQAAFVDDPRDCVQKADVLVSDVVDRLTAGFSQARSGLEEQWSRGEQVSTEDLRIALQRYRDFFERLLAV
jgi:hypothetical protein